MDSGHRSVWRMAATWHCSTSIGWTRQTPQYFCYNNSTICTPVISPLLFHAFYPSPFFNDCFILYNCTTLTFYFAANLTNAAFYITWGNDNNDANKRTKQHYNTEQQQHSTAYLCFNCRRERLPEITASSNILITCYSFTAILLLSVLIFVQISISVQSFISVQLSLIRSFSLSEVIGLLEKMSF